MCCSMSSPESELVPLRRDPLLPPHDCPVVWRRSDRARRVSLKVDAVAGCVVVTLPKRTSREAGLRLLHVHAGWVLQRMADLAPVTRLADGASVPLGGVVHQIRHREGQRSMPLVEDGQIIVGGSAEAVPGRVLRFLRSEAERRLGAAVTPHAVRVGVTPRAIRLKDTTSRWASCAPDRTLSFSWRLVMAPDWVLDYVVAHEVAHLREMNHSPAFWTLCESLTPHRAAATAWLRQNGAGLLRVAT